MTPVIFNCLLLYALVILFSLFQTRFKLLTDSPITFVILLILTPILVLGKAKRVDTWVELTGLEIFGYTIVWSLINAKHMVPKINEGYILAYTLFHWYLLGDSIALKGFNFWLTTIGIISIIPTILILKAAFEENFLSQIQKIIIYYWFLFTVIFTFIDQAALGIIEPIIAFSKIDFVSTTYIVFSAVQLYFISTFLSLLFVGIPLFHMDKNTNWYQARKECKEIREHKLDNYIEYQISIKMSILIILISGILFYLDHAYNFRQYLIAFYTLVFPIVFFYFKWSPEISFINNNSKKKKE